jgi:hypothetical protein
VERRGVVILVREDPMKNTPVYQVEGPDSEKIKDKELRKTGQAYVTERGSLSGRVSLESLKGGRKVTLTAW